MPLFNFLRLKTWRWNLWFDGQKRLTYRVHHFLPKMLWNACEMFVMQLWMQDGKDDLTGLRNNNGVPKFIWRKRDPTPLRGNVVSLGKMIVYYRIDSYMKTKLFSETSWPDTLLMILMRKWRVIVSRSLVRTC